MTTGSWLVALWEAASGPSAPALAQHAAGQLAAFAVDTTASGSGGPSWDSVTPFLNVGITGVVLLMVLFRKGIVPEWSLRDAEKRIEALQARNSDLEDRLRDSTNLMMTQVMPVTTRAVDVTADLLDHLQDQREGRNRRSTDRGEWRNDDRDERDERGRAPRGR